MAKMQNLLIASLLLGSTVFAAPVQEHFHGLSKIQAGSPLAAGNSSGLHQRSANLEQGISGMNGKQQPMPVFAGQAQLRSASLEQEMAMQHPKPMVAVRASSLEQESPVKQPIFFVNSQLRSAVAKDLASPIHQQAVAASQLHQRSMKLEQGMPQSLPVFASQAHLRSASLEQESPLEQAAEATAQQKSMKQEQEMVMENVKQAVASQLTQQTQLRSASLEQETPLEQAVPAYLYERSAGLEQESPVELAKQQQLAAFLQQRSANLEQGMPQPMPVFASPAQMRSAGLEQESPVESLSQEQLAAFLQQRSANLESMIEALEASNLARKSMNFAHESPVEHLHGQETPLAHAHQQAIANAGF